MATSKAAGGGKGNGIRKGTREEDVRDRDVKAAGGAKAPRARRAQADEPPTEDTPKRRTTVPPNSIRPSRPRKRSAREDWRAQGNGRADATTESRGRGTASREDVAPPGPSAPKSESDSWAVPYSVKDRFARDGRRYYFPDGAPAFRDHGRRLTTPSANTEVIATLIEIAKARGWDSITVRGTAHFRQEAWKQGKLAGLEVRGYRASTGERSAMIRSLARNADEARAESGSANPGRDPPRPEPLNEAQRNAGVRAKAEAPIAGKLLDHGADHYKFNPRADRSYFVRIETPEGKREIWGTDFERALKTSLSQPQIGDHVVLQRKGAEPVNIVRRELDAKGKILSETQLKTQRNTWSVERSDFLMARAQAAETLRDPSITPRQVAQRHPELAGTLLQLHAAVLVARRAPDPRDGADFVATIRNALADKVARGDPLQPVRLRTRPTEREPPERESAPVR